MESIAGQSTSLRAIRRLVSVVIAPFFILAETGCIIIPVPSVTPDYETDIIYDATLEPLIGLQQNEVTIVQQHPVFL